MKSADGLWTLWWSNSGLMNTLKSDARLPTDMRARLVGMQARAVANNYTGYSDDCFSILCMQTIANKNHGTKN